MTYSPIIPSSGLVGWKFLERTYEIQKASFDRSPLITRDTAYFEENIGNVNSAEDLVSDRRLLRVALGAFGLQDDINNKYFIQKVLEEGTLEADSLANKLSDERYKDLANAFGFDRGTPSTKISTFGMDITEKFRRQEFELAVGDQDETMRLALNAERSLQDIAEDESSIDTKWFRIMGNPPLREVFETAFNLPTSFGQLDIDQQLEVFKDRADSVLGSEDPSDLADEEARNKLIQRYLLGSQLSEIQASSSASIAQSILQSAISFGRSLQNY